MLREATIIISLTEREDNGYEVAVPCLMDTGYDSYLIARESYINTILQKYPRLNDAWIIEKTNDCLKTASNTTIYLTKYIFMFIKIGSIKTRVQVAVTKTLTDDLVLGCQVIGLILKSEAEISIGLRKGPNSKNNKNNNNDGKEEIIMSLRYHNDNRETDEIKIFPDYYSAKDAAAQRNVAIEEGIARNMKEKPQEAQEINLKEKPKEAQENPPASSFDDCTAVIKDKDTEEHEVPAELCSKMVIPPNSYPVTIRGMKSNDSSEDKSNHRQETEKEEDDWSPAREYGKELSKIFAVQNINLKPSMRKFHLIPVYMAKGQIAHRQKCPLKKVFLKLNPQLSHKLGTKKSDNQKIINVCGPDDHPKTIETEKGPILIIRIPVKNAINKPITITKGEEIGTIHTLLISKHRVITKIISDLQAFKENVEPYMDPNQKVATLSRKRNIVPPIVENGTNIRSMADLFAEQNLEEDEDLRLTKAEECKYSVSIDYPDKDDESPMIVPHSFTGIWKEKFEKLVQREDVKQVFQNSTKKPFSKIKGYEAKITLKEATTLKNHTPFKQSPEVTKSTLKMIQEEIDRGIYEISTSPWAAPAFTIKKATKEGEPTKLRLVIDFSELSKKTMIRQNQQRSPDEILFNDFDHRWTHFAVFDMRSSYHQVALDPASANLMTFRVAGSPLRYKMMRPGFGFVNSGFFLEECLRVTLEEPLMRENPDNPIVIRKFIDDMVVFGTSEEDLFRQVEIVLKKMSEIGLRLNSKKCSFCIKRMEWCSFIVMNGRIFSNNKFLRQLEEMKKRTPTTLRQTQAAMGLLSYLSRFVPRFSTLAEPIYSGYNIGGKFEWTPSMNEAYQKLLDQCLKNRKIKLIEYGPDKNIKIIVDGSRSGFSILLCQENESNELELINAYSRVLSKKERFSAFQSELIALMSIVDVYGFLAYENTTKKTIMTDCRALYLLSKNNKTNSKFNAMFSYLENLLAPLEFEWIPGQEMDKTGDVGSRLAKNKFAEPEMSSDKRRFLDLIISKDEIGKVVQLERDFFRKSETGDEIFYTGSVNLEEPKLEPLKKEAPKKAAKKSRKKKPPDKEEKEENQQEVNNPTEDNDTTNQDAAIKGIKESGWRPQGFDKANEEEDSSEDEEEEAELSRANVNSVLYKNQEILDQNEMARKNHVNGAHFPIDKLRKYYKITEAKANQIVKNCKQCCSNPEKSSHMRFNAPRFLPPTPFSIIAADIFSLDGKTALIMVCELTNFAMVERLNSKSTADIILAMSRAFKITGPPSKLRTDNEPVFRSEKIYDYCAANGIEIIPTIPMVKNGNPSETRIRSFKLQAERMMLGKKWCEPHNLMKILNVINFSHTNKLSTSPHDAVFTFKSNVDTSITGKQQQFKEFTNLVTQNDKILNKWITAIEENNEKRVSHEEKQVRIDQNFKEGEFVKFMDKLNPLGNSWKNGIYYGRSDNAALVKDIETGVVKKRSFTHVLKR